MLSIDDKHQSREHVAAPEEAADDDVLLSSAPSLHQGALRAVRDEGVISRSVPSALHRV